MKKTSQISAWGDSLQWKVTTVYKKKIHKKNHHKALARHLLVWLQGYDFLFDQKRIWCELMPGCTCPKMSNMRWKTWVSKYTTLSVWAWENWNRSETRPAKTKNCRLSHSRWDKGSQKNNTKYNLQYVSIDLQKWYCTGEWRSNSWVTLDNIQINTTRNPTVNPPRPHRYRKMLTGQSQQWTGKANMKTLTKMASKSHIY